MGDIDMVLSSYAAGVFTNEAITIQDKAKLQTDVDLTERAIRNAATYQRNYAIFNATVHGNPSNVPTVDSILVLLEETKANFPTENGIDKNKQDQDQPKQTVAKAPTPAGELTLPVLFHTFHIQYTLLRDSF